MAQLTARLLPIPEDPVLNQLLHFFSSPYFEILATEFQVFTIVSFLTRQGSEHGWLVQLYNEIMKQGFKYTIKLVIIFNRATYKCTSGSLINNA